MKLTCIHCGKAVTNELPDDVNLRGTVTCPECEELLPSLDKIEEKCDRRMDEVEARMRRKVERLQSVTLSLFTQGLAMFDEGVTHWHEAETSLSAHEWLGLSMEEYGMWMTMRPPKGMPLYKQALEEIQRVLSGDLTVQRPLEQVIAEIVEKALKED